MGKASSAKRLRRQEMQAQAARKEKIQRTLADRVQQALPDEKIAVVKRKTGPKVSDMVTEFARPWLDEARNEEQRKFVIGMAVLAWNMAAFPEPERWEGMDQEFAERLGDQGKWVLKEMIDRKLSLYQDETRHILDYEISGEGDKMRLDVIYTAHPEDISNLKVRGGL